MLNVAGLLYLGSRTVSAAGNLLAVIIFTRLAGPAEYGHYVLIFAWSLIVYGFGAQWMRFAYFGVYRPDRFVEYAASLTRLIALGIVLVAAVLAVVGWFGVFEPEFLVAVFALVCGMTIYEAAFEVARTLLYTRGTTLSMLLRAALTVAFGSIGLALGGGALGLAIAIAFAHLIAAVPSLAALARIRFRFSAATHAASAHILSYGWPLFLSFGISALGQGIDRLTLEHYFGAAALGPYGVVADMLRQTFTVFGEVIILALVTIAKQHANLGHTEEAQSILRKAFNACLAAAAFGAAFFIVFGDAVLRLVLKPEFIAPTHPLIPIFALAFAFITMRNYYFAQVIYFSRASYLELLVSFMFLAVSSVVSILLVPRYGLEGAAYALLAAGSSSCLAFIVLGRRWYQMPVDPTGFTIITGLACLLVLGSRATADLVPAEGAALVLDSALFALIGAFAIKHFGLFKAVPTVTIQEIPTS